MRFPPRFDNGNERNIKVRYCCIEFLRNRWSAQINNNKPCETSQCFDGFRIISLVWPVKVKEHWQILHLSQLCCDGLQHLQSSIAKAPKQKDASFCNCVEDIAKFLMVEQQIYELGNLEIINGDDWFIEGCDNEVILCSSF